MIGSAGNDYLAKSGITDDTFFGLQGADTLLSYGGVDILFGGAGDDLLYSGDLADWLYGDGGNDTLYGEDGWDILYADNETRVEGDDETSRNLLIGGAGGDVLSGSRGRDTLLGGDDQDTLSGGGGADWLQGGTGADNFLINLSINPITVSSFTDADTVADFSLSEGDTLSLGLTGGMLTGPNGPTPLVWRGSLLAPGGPTLGLALPGDDLGAAYLQAWLLIPDSALARNGGWVVLDLDQNGSLGTVDIVFRLQASDLSSGLLFTAADTQSFAAWAGASGDDVLQARSSGSRLFGLGGADVLLGGNGNDSLSGGDGSDTLAGDNGDDQLWGGAGNDWLLGSNGNDALYASGPGVTEIDDTSAINRLEGEGGNDSLYGGLGSDCLIGGAGNDFLVGDDGADTLEGGTGNDTLSGGTGTDSLIGGAGTDSIDGGSGNDTIVYGETSDRLDGGDGFDWLVISNGLSFNLSVTENQASGGAWLARFEAVNASASSGAVTLVGGGEDNILIGGSASDSILGAAGDDLLQGGPGNDTLVAGSGLNIVEGGAGNDRFIVESVDEVVIEYYSDGNDTIIASCDFYLPAEVETLVLAPGSAAMRGGGGLGNNLLIGNSHANELLGSEGSDTLESGDGADTLQGGEQDDILLAGNQADILYGGEGNDSLDGGAADDTVIGGAGADTMAGGGGDDFYVLDDIEDLILENSMAGNDTIMTTTDLLIPANIEIIVVGQGASGLSLLGGGLGDIIFGNGSGHDFEGGLGNDIILADGLNPANILALFDGWF
ncbi:MAG: hypothetical protein ING02_15795 [Roseomonas sp.]|nr:hypothetical protein [Roseomonas sp.]